MVMGTLIKTTVFALAGCAIAVNATAQTPSSSLAEALSSSVCERIQAPVVFSTRDSLFALSLPTDEPATIFLQVTVGKNGKVREKLTRVDANHLAGYVAPVFVAATKDLRVDRSLLGNLAGKDTSLLLAFPMEYQCVYDTINKEWPDMTPITIQFSDKAYESSLYGSNSSSAMQERINEGIFYTPNPWGEYRRAKPTRIWYYLAFIKESQE